MTTAPATLSSPLALLQSHLRAVPAADAEIQEAAAAEVEDGQGIACVYSGH